MPKETGWDLFEKWWPDDWSLIDAHVWWIQQGEDYLKAQGRTLFYHYRELQSLLWVNYQHHEWSDLMLKTILENRITAVLGPKDAGKTHVMARFALTDYFCFPRDTLILMSSTDIRGLELRVFGEVKLLYETAKEVWPEAPGNPVDSLHAIFTDAIDEDSEIRDTRRGLICIPVLDFSGQWKGLSKWVGIKQKRRRVLADETQFYAAPYLSSLANLDKGDFKGVFVGNPIGEGDPLDKIAEPVDGWDSLPEISTTTVWTNRMGGTTINFTGTDSPAIKHPGQFKYLINQADIDRIIGYWGRESAEYWNQAAGVRRPGISLRRVVTRDMATQFGAQQDVIWKDSNTTKVYAVDAGYGGDRCVGGEAEFGTDINGQQVLCLSKPRIIPVRVYPKTVPIEQRTLPEDQIAEYVKADCEKLGIPAANVAHDSTGRGSLGTSFARLWRHDCNPVEFGGAPTPRPVSSDLFIYDEKLKQKRLKRCDEHYSKRVSEYHFSVRYVIEGRQMRGLTNEVLDELCGREWKRVKGDKIEVEAKDETKERIGRSPDLGDWCAIVVEMARRLGFQIARFEPPESKFEDSAWKHDLRLRAKRFKASYSLTR
jgi:hypothetical protein